MIRLDPAMCISSWSWSARAIFVAIAIVLSSMPACALELYTNGAPNGNTEGENLAVTNQVTNSFVLSQASTLQQVANLGIWVKTGDTPTSVSWSIGSTAFGADLFSGTNAPLSNTFVKAITVDPGHDLYSSSITLGSLNLPAGTYWLTLTDGVAPQAVIDWDYSGGPSQAFTRIGSSGTPVAVPQSQAFTIIGVPEPSSLVMAGIAAFAWHAALRSRSSKWNRRGR